MMMAATTSQSESGGKNSENSLAETDRQHSPVAAPGDHVTPGIRAQEATPLGNQGATLPLNIRDTAKEGVVMTTSGGVAQTTTPTASTNPVGVAVATVPASVILTLVSPKDGAGNLTTTPMVKPKLTKQEREMQRVERERVKAELKAKKEEERLKKEQERQLREQEKKEKQMKREQELRERQVKKEQEELEKKERREKREAEKRRKDEEKQQKLEEKRKLEQEKEQLKEEKRCREKQARLKFRSYFGKVEKPVVKEEAVSEGILTGFSLKDGMFLAKPSHNPLHDTSEFDRLVGLQAPEFVPSYINTCKRIPKRSFRQKNELSGGGGGEESGDDSVVMISDSGSAPRQRLPKFKLLQFHQNHRPAYYGSWQRPRGSIITPRNPFRKDNGVLDYEVDSDDEWEEEEPGESISDSEGEEKGEGEGEDSDDEDDGFFVPHGYLSNDEGVCSDSGEFLDEDGETERSKQLAKAKAWEADFARKCQRLEPKLTGCHWLSVAQCSGKEKKGEGEAREEERVVSSEEGFLMQFAIVPLVPLPISVVTTKGETTAQKSENQGNAESTKQPVPEEAMPDLIRFIHKNSLGVSKIIKTFRTHWGAKLVSNSPLPPPPPPPHRSPSPAQANPTAPLALADSTPNNAALPESQEYESASKISKRQVEQKIRAIAVKEVRLPISKAAWYVHDAVLRKYGLDQENFDPLILNVSPSLGVRSAEHQTPPPFKARFITPQKPKVSKRRSPSLLDFLSKSPAGSPPKRLKMEPTTHPKTETTPLKAAANDDDDVIILDSFPPKALSPVMNDTSTSASSNADQPLAKRPCLSVRGELEAADKDSSHLQMIQCS